MKNYVELNLYSLLTFMIYTQWYVHGNIETIFDDLMNDELYREGQASVEIDKDHLKRNPECGYLPDKQNRPLGASRIINAEESDRHSP